MFLTDPQLEALTGFKRPAEQRTWLSERGYRFEVAGTGSPAVLRDHVRERLMDRPGGSVTVAGPDWSVLDKAN